jgi:PAS fold
MHLVDKAASLSKNPNSLCGVGEIVVRRAVSSATHPATDLSPDCRYLQINQRLTEICGISVEDHLGRSVRDCVPVLAHAVEDIVRSIMNTGEAVTGIEVAGQPADQTDERFWVTYWHPLSITWSNRQNCRRQCRCEGDHRAQACGSSATG